MELFIVLLLLGLGYGVRGASDRVRGDLRKSREAKVKEAAKAAGGKLPKHQRAAVARQHTRGWWAREVTGGFPAARTGWHAGWIAHKTALARQQIIREEARTEHAETQTSFRKDLAAHQKRQAEARAELERELAAQQAKGSPATGKSAVQKAADEVSRKREEKAARERKAPPAATGTETAVPPLPADSVGGARRDARPARQAWEDGQERLIAQRHAEFEREMAGDSDWLRPGHRRCEGCGGSGRNADGTDACPACRGFGNAPPSPMSPVALADAVCTACGNTGRPGDPVLADPGGNIHLSHAKEGQERYWDALNRMRQAGREPGLDAARWSPGPDSGDQSRGAAKEALGTAVCPRCCTTLTGASLENSLWCPRCEDLVHKSEWATPDDDRHAETDGGDWPWVDPREEDPDGRHAEIDDAVVAADHGYEGEFELAPSPTTTEVPPVRRAREDAEAADDAYRAAQAAGASDATLEDLALDAHDADAAYHRTLDQFDPPPPTTEGAPVPDTNYTAVLNNAKAEVTQAEQDLAAASSRRSRAEQHLEGMQAVDVGAQSLSSQMDHVDALKAQETGARQVLEHAQATADAVTREHGGIKSAADDAPVVMAQREFYGGD